jgi:MoaA/NifB/PqqE/SkfB family radical SAM enzyme
MLGLPRFRAPRPFLVQIETGPEKLERLAVIHSLRDNRAENRRERMAGNAEPVSPRPVFTGFVNQRLAHIENNGLNHAGSLQYVRSPSVPVSCRKRHVIGTLSCTRKNISRQTRQNGIIHQDCAAERPTAGTGRREPGPAGGPPVSRAAPCPASDGGQAMSAITAEATAAGQAAPEIPTFLELEITQFCQLKCTHCYSKSGPHGGEGTMTPDDWEQVMDQAHALGVDTVQFIGGEPTLHPDIIRLARYGLGIGLNVDIYSNLVHVTPAMWDLFTTPGVSVGFSWYSADPGKHAEITGSRASHGRTKASIREAVMLGVTLRAGLVEITEGQDIDAAMAELRALGVTDMSADRSRGVGRAARGAAPEISELCGRCGKGRAAIGMDGQVTPCVLGRFLVAGNVKNTPLAEIFAGQAWHEILAAVPAVDACVTCTPADSNDCDPSRRPAA